MVQKNLAITHYRGYGGSDGEPGEVSLFSDALNLYKNVSESYDDIILIGRSLGSGIATRLAAETTPSKLILITPYNSIEEVASEKFWWVPVSLLIKDKYQSWQYAKGVKTNTAFLVATNDKVIPMHSSMKLFYSFNEELTEIYTFQNAGHNSISASQKYYDLLHELTN